MIAPGAGVRVYLACGATDMRKGIGGLCAVAQEVLRQDAEAILASATAFLYAASVMILLRRIAKAS